MANVRPLADSAGIRIEARIPADPSLLAEDRCTLGRFCRPVMEWAVARSKRDSVLNIGLQLTDDETVWLEIADSTLFSSWDAERCHRVRRNRNIEALPDAVADELDDIAAIGGKLLDCGDAGQIQMFLALPNTNQAAEATAS
ncbi:MAG: hypothetical protein RIE24_00495 [Silicimonas sp.]|uniref:hypothetical protein n=1 Tax=Roseitalea porphyridii TaxID=1852022 RepID=UPI0032ED33BB